MYQNIVVARNQDQLTFYTDGIPVMTTPVPDITFVEGSPISLLSHPNPESILVFGGEPAELSMKSSSIQALRPLITLKSTPNS